MIAYLCTASITNYNYSDICLKWFSRLKIASGWSEPGFFWCMMTIANVMQLFYDDVTQPRHKRVIFEAQIFKWARWINNFGSNNCNLSLKKLLSNAR